MQFVETLLGHKPPGSLAIPKALRAVGHHRPGRPKRPPRVEFFFDFASPWSYLGPFNYGASPHLASFFYIIIDKL